jgi:hypothetical protein
MSGTINLFSKFHAELHEKFKIKAFSYYLVYGPKKNWKLVQDNFSLTYSFYSKSLTFFPLQVVETTRVYIFEVTIQENPFKKKHFNF